MDTAGTTSNETPTTPVWWGWWVIVAATLVWFVGTQRLFLWGFGLGLDFSGDPLAPEVQAEVDGRFRIAVIVLVTGPAVIALFAIIAERARTALVYFLIALSLACLSASQAWVRDVFTTPPAVEVEEPERDRDQCLPISGSDRTCPGG
jgi:hypothetical protein